MVILAALGIIDRLNYYNPGYFFFFLATADIPPVVMVYGNMPVMSMDL